MGIPDQSNGPFAKNDSFCFAAVGGIPLFLSFTALIPALSLQSQVVLSGTQVFAQHRLLAKQEKGQKNAASRGKEAAKEKRRENEKEVS